MPLSPAKASGGSGCVGQLRGRKWNGEGPMMASQIQVGGRVLIGATPVALRIDGAELYCRAAQVDKVRAPHRHSHNVVGFLECPAKFGTELLVGSGAGCFVQPVK